MANDDLLRTLHETRQELVTERGERLGTIAEREDDLRAAKENLRVAREQERIAIQSDEDVKGKMKAVSDHLSGQVSTPQALHEKLNRLGVDQAQTYRKRCDWSEVAHRRQMELGEIETRLAVAQADLKTAEKNLADLDEQIRQVRGY